MSERIVPVPSLEAFRAEAERLGLRIDEAELRELHDAYAALGRSLARLHARDDAGLDVWPQSIVEAWESGAAP
jgi:hypothetical protein